MKSNENEGKDLELPDPQPAEQPQSFWKHPRNNSRWVTQWLRRQAQAVASQSCPFILQEIEQRMRLRASIMRPVEGPILHQGWPEYAQAEFLAAQYPERALHWSTPNPLGLNALEQAKPRSSSQLFGVPKVLSGLEKWLPKFGSTHNSIQKIIHLLAGPQARIEVADNFFSMVWSPLWLHHINDPRVQLKEWHRVLKPQGVLFFSCFGPDTAQELQGMVRKACGVDAVLPDFADMHDWGDILVQHGFSDPVMEMEKITLVYQNTRQLLAEWHALVGNNAQVRSDSNNTLPKGLGPAKRWQAAMNKLDESHPQHKLTLEIIYGHAWKIERLPPGVAVVNLDGITRKNNKKHT